ncbi:MAG TPA: (Fe-S)-binding protein [Actinomycetota bacterium]|jgi:glycolate oxidase iron-sulfur subunit|nr:(Fe-S)-binding protein [Actinomycetota bacterium]
MDLSPAGSAPIGAELPEGARFIGPIPGSEPRWRPGLEAPAEDDLATCVNCGLCLPHCPTYRLTGEESASPRGRINAMRAVADGHGEVDRTLASFMDLCLACRACEDVCPSHVPFGRMMERARVQIEPLRGRRARFVRWLGLDVALPRKKLLWVVAALQPLARPFLGRRVRALVPPRSELFHRLPRVTPPEGDERGTVAVHTGCVQDRWFRPLNRATIRVLARNGWRVVVPRGQACCGALAAHNGRLRTARRLVERNLRAFAEADTVIVSAGACGAHLREAGELLGTEEAGAFGAKARDVMAFLHEEGTRAPGPGTTLGRVAYHDACHALRVLKLNAQPRGVLRKVPGLELVEIPNGDRCCGAAGLYNVTQPGMSDALMREKAQAIASTGADVVASANPGCTMQIRAGLRAMGSMLEVLHPVEILDRAYGN